MAIDHAALSTLLGKVLGAIKEANTFRGATLTTREATLRTAFGTDDNDILSDLATNRAQAHDSLNGWTDWLSGRVEETVLQTVNDDRGWQTDDIDRALGEWVRQLRNDVQSFNDCPVTLAFAAATGAPAIVGDITFHTSDLDTDGRKTDFGIPDVMLVTVDLDADNGGTRWAETLGIVSKVADSLVLDAAYPTGAGLDTQLAVIDPATNGGVVTDGGFDLYDTGEFTSWTRLPSTTAADSFQGTDDLRDGSDGFCLTLVSDGTNVPGVKQAVTLSASTVYSLHFAVKGLNAAEGTAKVILTIRDTDTGNVITDDQAVAIRKKSDTMTVLVGSGVYTHYTLDFATPKRLPAGGVYLDIRLANGTTDTTAATVATSAEVDHVVLTEMTELYDKGVRLVAYSGAVEPDRDDQWEYTVALTSGVVSSYFIRWLDRTIGLTNRSYKVPTATGGAETILDSLIV